MPASRRPSLLPALGLALALAFPLTARADPPSRPEVVAQLSGFEHPPDLAVVRSWSSPGVGLLLEVADDADELIFTRARALWALRGFPQVPVARSYLQAVAAVPSQNPFLLRAALDSLVALGDLATPLRSLDDASPETREAAVWALANAPGSEVAQRGLQRRLLRERAPSVQHCLRQVLAAPRP